MGQPRILAFSGSTRSGSLNTKLVEATAALATDRGAEVTTISIADYDLPLYNGDIEADGLPQGALDLKSAFEAHDGLLIACPEYNGSITPLLKNVIDWVSRQREGEPMVASYRGLVAGLIAGSPGGLGGIRGLAHVRTILSGIGVHVIPTQVAVGKVHEAFADDGSIANEHQAGMLAGFADELVRTTAALSQ